MKKHQIILLIIISVFTVKSSYAQLLFIDTTFQIGTGAGSSVNKIDIQSTGKLIVSGEFQTFKGSTQKRIVRLVF
jgi:hypothetical protein